MAKKKSDESGEVTEVTDVVVAEAAAEAVAKVLPEVQPEVSVVSAAELPELKLATVFVKGNKTYAL